MVIVDSDCERLFESTRGEAEIIGVSEKIGLIIKEILLAEAVWL